MKCKGCKTNVSLVEIYFPAGAHPRRVQSDHPFPVARCKICEGLNEVVVAPDGTAECVKLIDESARHRGG